MSTLLNYLNTSFYNYPTTPTHFKRKYPFIKRKNSIRDKLLASNLKHELFLENTFFPKPPKNFVLKKKEALRTKVKVLKTLKKLNSFTFRKLLKKASAFANAEIERFFTKKSLAQAFSWNNYIKVNQQAEKHAKTQKLSLTYLTSPYGYRVSSIGLEVMFQTSLNRNMPFLAEYNMKPQFFLFHELKIPKDLHLASLAEQLFFTTPPLLSIRKGSVVVSEFGHNAFQDFYRDSFLKDHSQFDYTNYNTLCYHKALFRALSISKKKFIHTEYLSFGQEQQDHFYFSRSLDPFYRPIMKETAFEKLSLNDIRNANDFISTYDPWYKNFELKNKHFIRFSQVDRKFFIPGPKISFLIDPKSKDFNLSDMFFGSGRHHHDYFINKIRKFQLNPKDIPLRYDNRFRDFFNGKIKSTRNLFDSFRIKRKKSNPKIFRKLKRNLVFVNKPYFKRLAQRNKAVEQEIFKSYNFKEEPNFIDTFKTKTYKPSDPQEILDIINMFKIPKGRFVPVKKKKVLLDKDRKTAFYLRFKKIKNKTKLNFGLLKKSLSLSKFNNRHSLQGKLLIKKTNSLIKTYNLKLIKKINYFFKALLSSERRREFDQMSLNDHFVNLLKVRIFNSFKFSIFKILKSKKKRKYYSLRIKKKILKDFLVEKMFKRLKTRKKKRKLPFFYFVLNAIAFKLNKKIKAVYKSFFNKTWGLKSSFLNFIRLKNKIIKKKRVTLNSFSYLKQLNIKNPEVSVSIINFLKFGIFKKDFLKYRNKMHFFKNKFAFTFMLRSSIIDVSPKYIFSKSENPLLKRRLFQHYLRRVVRVAKFFPNPKKRRIRAFLRRYTARRYGFKTIRNFVLTLEGGKLLRNYKVLSSFHHSLNNEEEDNGVNGEINFIKSFIKKKKSISCCCVEYFYSY